MQILCPEFLAVPLAIWAHVAQLVHEPDHLHVLAMDCDIVVVHATPGCPHLFFRQSIRVWPVAFKGLQNIRPAFMTGSLSMLRPSKITRHNPARLQLVIAPTF